MDSPNEAIPVPNPVRKNERRRSRRFSRSLSRRGSKSGTIANMLKRNSRSNSELNIIIGDDITAREVDALGDRNEDWGSSGAKIGGYASKTF